LARGGRAMRTWIRLLIAQAVVALVLLISAVWYTAALAAYGRCSQ
jgi:hypothetical protein